MRSILACLAILLGLGLLTGSADGMCGYFRPIVVNIKSPTEIEQPSQIAFITWDAENMVETVTVQPRFEGNALDFAMVIPTPSQPKLHEMPRDFFKALGLLTRPKERTFPQSKLMPMVAIGGLGGPRVEMATAKSPAGAGNIQPARPTTVEVVEVGVVGNLDYKIISAGRADDLFQWLKDNKYNYGGDEATLNHYVQRKYWFTVMKIDTLQMKKNKDGSYTGDVTPTRFSFKSDELVYPLKITQVSVKDKTEAVFYVQSSVKMDLPGEDSYQYHWLSLLDFVQNTIGLHDLPEKNRNWIKSIQEAKPAVLKRGQDLGFTFNFHPDAFVGRPVKIRPEGAKRNAERQAATLEWAKKLTAQDIQVITGDVPYSETVPDPDDGFTQVDLRDQRKAPAIFKVIQARLAKANKDRPRGYLTRQASKEDLKLLPLLKGHVQEGQYLTRFRKSFNRDEMNEDLVLVAAKVGNHADVSEHEEVLRTMIGGFRGLPDVDVILPPGGPGGPRVPPVRLPPVRPQPERD